MSWHTTASSNQLPTVYTDAATLIPRTLEDVESERINLERGQASGEVKAAESGGVKGQVSFNAITIMPLSIFPIEEEGAGRRVVRSDNRQVRGANRHRDDFKLFPSACGLSRVLVTDLALSRFMSRAPLNEQTDRKRSKGRRCREGKENYFSGNLPVDGWSIQSGESVAERRSSGYTARKFF